MVERLEDRLERERGTDPTSPTVQTPARRWRELIGRFTGGDESIYRSLQEMYGKEGAQSASRGVFDDELMEYVGRALAADR
jgi:MerR family transcriptional regulator, thiopeptide resistance regulator